MAVVRGSANLELGGRGVEAKGRDPPPSDVLPLAEHPHAPVTVDESIVTGLPYFITYVMGYGSENEELAMPALLYNRSCDGGDPIFVEEDWVFWF